MYQYPWENSIHRARVSSYFGEVQIINGVRNLSQPFSKSVLTVGNFDGLHLGHRALFERVRERSQELALPSVVMTFDPHPMKVLHPARGLQRIFDFDDQRRGLEELGFDYLVVEPFSREFSQLAPDRYLLEWIFRPFSPETLVVGYDFTFGANREGSIDFLKTRSSELGFSVEVIPPVRIGEVLVSSTRIRQALHDGDVTLARKLLGRPFYLTGVVEKGFGRGRTIGIPTANLRTNAETIPARGVYCGWVTVLSHPRKKFMSLVNVGLNPTFTENHGQALSIEAHILDYDQDIYGEMIQIEFVERIREEKKFAGVSELVGQIQADIIEGRRLLLIERQPGGN